MSSPSNLEAAAAPINTEKRPGDDESTPLVKGDNAQAVEAAEMPSFYIPRRWIVTAMAFLGANVSYILRVTTSTTIAPMRKERGWTIGQETHVLSGFYMGYLVTMFFGGFISQRIGAKKTLLFSIILSALATTMIAVSVKVYWLVVLLRVITGLCSGPTFPALTHLITKWIPIQERTFATTVVMGGSAIGTIFVFFVSPLIISSNFGWRAVYYLHGIIAISWAVCWLFLVNRSAEHSKGNRLKAVRIHDSELKYIRGGIVEATQMGFPWGKALSSVPLLTLMLCFHLNAWGGYLMLNWLPTYFDSLHYPAGTQALILTLGYGLAFIIGLLVGKVADALIAAGWSVTLVRRLVGGIGTGVACVATWLVVYGVVPGGVLCVAVAALGLNVAAMNANMLDLAPSRAGVIMSICGTLATLPGVISVELAGKILDTKYGWPGVFFMSAVTLSASFVSWVLLASGKSVL